MSVSRWQRLVAFVNTEEDATGLALMRIIACGTLLLHLVITLGSGAGRFLWTHVDDGGLSTEAWSRTLGSNGVVGLAVLVALCAALGAAGWFTRFGVLGCFLGMRVLSELAGSARGGYDRLLINVLFLLLVSGCAHALSVDARSGERPARRLVRVLAVLQLTLLYFGSGSYKLSLSWVPGGDATALWYTLQQPMWARFAGPLPMWMFPLTQVATLSVWAFEMAAPLFLLAFILDERGSTSWLARAFRKVRFRGLYLLFGVSMHLGIEALMEVGPFIGASLSLYPCAIDPATWTRWRERLRARFRQEPVSVGST